MSKEVRQEILDFLLKESREHGLAVVKDACNLFLKTGLRLGIDPTIRRPAPRTWVQKLWQKQHGICARCKDPQPMRIEDATFDHIVPLVEGGEHSMKNGRVTHGYCNSAKGGRGLIDESKRTGQMLSETFAGTEE